MAKQKIVISDLMSEVEKLPPTEELTKLFHNRMFKTRHYMFYTKVSKGKYLGFCSCGAAGIELTGCQTGTYIKCPGCGKSVRLRNSIYNHEIQDTGYFAYLQKTSYGLMQRLFYVDQHTNFNGSKTTVLYGMNEAQRDLLTLEGALKQYHMRCAWGEHGYERKWIKGRVPRPMGYCSEAFEDKPFLLWHKNVTAVLRDAARFKYSQLGTAAQHMWLNPLEYLRIYQRRPQLEFLIKLKLYRLAHEYYLYEDTWSSHISYFCGREKRIEDFLGTKDKAFLRLTQRLDMGKKEIDAARYIVESGQKPTVQSIEFVKAVKRCGLHGITRMTIGTFALYEYWKKQKKKYPLAQDFIQDYNDYLNWANDLEYDLNDTKNSKPKDFKYAHDVTYNRHEEWEEVQRKRAEKQRKKEEAAMERRRKKILAELTPKYAELFGYKAMGLCVIVPSSPDEIREEGKRQGHCVGTYVERVAQGRSVIVFIRETSQPDKAFYTVELNPMRNFELVQCRGKGNCGYGKDVETFLAKWQKEYTKRLAAMDEKRKDTEIRVKIAV